MAPRKKKKLKRRPPWKPTEQQQGEVRAFVQMGLPQEEIAKQMRVDIKTLRKHCRDILESSKVKFLAAVVNSLGRQALGAPAEYDKGGRMVREEVKPVPAAAMFILKTQGKEYGWVERTEHTGKNGLPLVPEDKLKGLSDEQLRILEKARAIVAGLVGPAGA